MTAAKSSAKDAPKAASWAYAENLVSQSEAAVSARQTAQEFGISPLSAGSAGALTVLAKAIGARAVVEIGTGSGVSGLALFAGMRPDGILTSVDIEAEHQRAARAAFVSVGIPTQRFRLIAGTALNVLPRLTDGAYDLVLVNADLVDYPAYVEQGIRLLRHGGVLVVDHALWQDKVADETDTDDETLSVRDAIALVTENEDLTSTLLPTGDGLLVAVKG